MERDWRSIFYWLLKGIWRCRSCNFTLNATTLWGRGSVFGSDYDDSLFCYSCARLVGCLFGGDGWTGEVLAVSFARFQLPSLFLWSDLNENVFTTKSSNFLVAYFLYKLWTTERRCVPKRLVKCCDVRKKIALKWS